MEKDRIFFSSHNSFARRSFRFAPRFRTAGLRKFIRCFIGTLLPKQRRSIAEVYCYSHEGVSLLAVGQLGGLEQHMMYRSPVGFDCWRLLGCAGRPVSRCNPTVYNVSKIAEFLTGGHGCYGYVGVFCDINFLLCGRL